MASWSLSFLICKIRTVRLSSQGCYGDSKTVKVPAHSRCSKTTSFCLFFAVTGKSLEDHQTMLLNNSKKKLKISHLINIPHSHPTPGNLQWRGGPLSKTDTPPPHPESHLGMGGSPQPSSPQIELAEGGHCSQVEADLMGRNGKFKW